MTVTEKPLILVVDDDTDILRLVELQLSKEGYAVVTAESGPAALKAISEVRPALILLDIMMPEMDGYEVCYRLRENEETAYIPVIFVTALGEEQNKARAFSLGAADYLVKPVKKKALLEAVSKNLKTKAHWDSIKEVRKATALLDEIQPFNYSRFMKFLGEKLDLSPDRIETIRGTKVSELFSITDHLGLSGNELARYIADFAGLPYISDIDSDSIQLGVLPATFCKKNNVAVIEDDSGKSLFVISNPFNWELLELLKSIFMDQPYNLAVADEKTISLLLGGDGKPDNRAALEERGVSGPPGVETGETGEGSIVEITEGILSSAVSERASDIHIEPKSDSAVIRFRIDGDLMERFTVRMELSNMIITRIKALAGMDVAVRRKPQDGSLETMISDRTFNLRLATTSTPYGESLIIRLLEPYHKARTITELGMTAEQSKTMLTLAERTHALVLVVGTTGSGKTTTIYSLLSQIDCKKRSLISVEDPIEYRIPFANQQQVDEMSGATFDALLKSAVRQDPDILFMGEVRDSFSARTAMSFASTGHLTITSLHTHDSTTAIYRLERLGITRDTIADTVIAVVGQKLVKKLCQYCKKIDPISPEESEMLSPFTGELPSMVAHPVGCPKCDHTGYYDREGVFETIVFDKDVSDLVYSGVAISEVKKLLMKRGEFLISDSAVEKVRNLVCSPKDIYANILLEEVRFQKERLLEEEQTEIRQPETAEHAIVRPELQGMEAGKGHVSHADERRVKEVSILVVEDDHSIQKLVTRYLGIRGYDIDVANDGIEALIHLGKKEYDLVISDIMMPNMDGYKLLEMLNQKGIDVPVLYLTAKTELEDEIKGLELGAVDYLRKPLQKDVLILRVQNFLETIRKSGGVTSAGAAATGKASEIVVYIDPEIEDMVPEFLENRRRDVEEIRKLLGEGRLEEIESKGHSMRGSGGGYGFDEITEIGTGIEEAVSRKDRAEIMKMNERLSSYLSRVRIEKKDEKVSEKL